MKKYFTKKNVLMTVLVIGIVFLFIASANSMVSERKNMDKDSDGLTVEMVEEFENISEEIEDEIEKYIEDDINDLDVQEEKEADGVEDETFDQTEKQVEEQVEGQTKEQAEEQVDTLPLMQRKKNSNELRIGFITDIHAKSKAGAVRSERIIKPTYKERINYFIEEMNNEFIPDFLLINGDIIEGTNRDNKVGSGMLRAVKRLFDRTLIPKYWVVGNHDLRAVNKEQFKQSLGIDYLDKSFDINDYRIIILDSNYDNENNDIKPGEYHTRGRVTPKQIKWLKNELDTDKRKIVFMHHPPLWDIDIHSNSGLPNNSLELQKVFSENNVTAVFSGHIEDLFYDKIDGVKYFVLPGVSKDDKYQGTFAEIGVVDDDIEFNISYIGSNGKYRKINIKEIVRSENRKN